MRALPEKIKRKVGRLLGREAAGGGDHSRAPTAPPELRGQAAKYIREYAEENETLFNRASRFEEKAERLQSSDGTTSESAQRRAERARSEIRAELSDLRSSFASAHGDEGRLAFDTELETLYPRLAAPDGEG